MYNLIKRNRDIKDGITLTVESGNNVRVFDFNPHITLHGLPQPLKSYLVSDITATLTTQYSHEEVKLVYSSRCDEVSKFDLSKETTELQKGIITVLETLNLEIKMREKILENKMYDGTLPRIVVILEYYSLTDDKIMELVEPIFNNGERIGVHLMIV